MCPILFKLGFLNFYSYGFFIALALFVPSYFFLKKAKVLKYDSKILENMIFYIFLSGIIGARVLYVLLNFKNFAESPLDVFKIWQGGLVFWGGFVFAFLTGALLIKKYKFDFWNFADLVAPYISLGHFFGRIGCLMAGCCYGKITSSTVSIVFKNPNSLAPTHISLFPTQIFEAILNFLIFFILLKFSNKKKFPGQIIGFYMIFYSVARFFVEFFRGDDRGYFGLLSMTQFISILVFFLGLAFLYFAFKQFSNQKSGLE